MLKWFPSKGTYYFIALLGCIFFSACAAIGVKQGESAQTPAVALIADVSPQKCRHLNNARYAKLNSSFMAKLQRVDDPDLRMDYTEGIHYLHRLAQDNPQNREILEKLVQHQEQTLDIFQICAGKEKVGKAFDWLTLSRSQFWKRADNSYLVLLVCSTGTSNRRFVPFLYFEANGTAKIKPLRLTQFLPREDGRLQRVDSEQVFGGPFPNTDQWFDPGTKELRNWTRLGGGSEPCGTKGTYRFQNEMLILQEFTARFNCDPKKKGDYEKLYP